MRNQSVQPNHKRVVISRESAASHKRNQQLLEMPNQSSPVKVKQDGPDPRESKDDDYNRYKKFELYQRQRYTEQLER